MVRKKSGFLIAAIVAIFSFIGVTWLSCTKVGPPVGKCNNVVCLNGGYCHKDTLTKLIECLCPSGFEGANCGIVSVNKFLDEWDMMQVVTGSDSAHFNVDSTDFLDDTSYYAVLLVKTATPTTFFIQHLHNNPYHNNIICMIDSIDANIFHIDTSSSYHFLYERYKLVAGYGSISADNSKITAHLVTRHLSATSNWIRDTFLFNMTRRP